LRGGCSPCLIHCIGHMAMIHLTAIGDGLEI
jgi:hypothetical protein